MSEISVTSKQLSVVGYWAYVISVTERSSSFQALKIRKLFIFSSPNGSIFRVSEHAFCLLSWYRHVASNLAGVAILSVSLWTVWRRMMSLSPNSVKSSLTVCFFPPFEGCRFVTSLPMRALPFRGVAGKRKTGTTKVRWRGREHYIALIGKNLVLHLSPSACCHLAWSTSSFPQKQQTLLPHSLNSAITIYIPRSWILQSRFRLSLRKFIQAAKTILIFVLW